MAKVKNRVTLSEFRKAFNAALPRLPEDPDLPSREWNKSRDELKEKLEKIFPSRSPSASLTVEQFDKKSAKAVAPPKKPGASRFTPSAQKDSNDYYTLYRIKNFMPTVQKFYEAARKKRDAAEQRRNERYRQREASKPKKRDSISERLDRLEQENASLRRRVNSGMSEYEADQRAREEYIKNDTRIGGSRGPSERIGLRD